MFGHQIQRGVHRENYVKIPQEDKLVVITGDFNINLLNHNSCIKTSSLGHHHYETIASYNFQSLILQLIDKIFTSNIHYETISDNLTTAVSHRFAKLSVP